MEQPEERPVELIKASVDWCGDLFWEEDMWKLRIDTDDNTSKENYDNLLDMLGDIRPTLFEYEVGEYFADHNTIIIDFIKK